MSVFKKLQKGSLQRKNKFNPRQEEHEDEVATAGAWQEDPELYFREQIREMPKELKNRVLHRLYSETHVRKDPITGERLFLMHRGMDDEEYNKFHKNGKSNYSYPTRTSWTTNFDIAKDFKKQYNDIPISNLDTGKTDFSKGYMVSAWIPEKDILSAPRFWTNENKKGDYKGKEGNSYNPYSGPEKGSTGFSSEREYIIEHSEPHSHAHPEFIKELKNKTKNINTRINSKKPKTNITQPKTQKKILKQSYIKNNPKKLAASEKNINNLNKGFIKNTMFAGMLGAASMASAQGSSNPIKQPAIASPKLEQKAKYSKDQILDAITQVESSGGKNTNHAVIKNPNNLNYGTRSSSAYGIMPITGKDIISKNLELKKQYGHLLNLKGDAFHKAYHKDPELDRKLASHHYDHIARNFGHDPAKIFYSWLNGINGTLKAIKQGKDIKNHWHVLKGKKALKNLKNNSG